MKRNFKGSFLVDRYIAGEFFLSFFVSFLFFFFMFFLNQILLMAENILAKRIPFVPVALLIVYSLPSIIALAFPFATLTGALMAYGRLASDNEILAMRATGFRRFDLFRPVLLLGILFAMTSFGVNDILLPIGSRAFRKLYRELIFRHPGLELEPFSVRRYRDIVIITGNVDEEGVKPLVIIEKRPSNDRMLIVAGQASADAPETQREGQPGLALMDIFTLTPDTQNKDSWTWGTADRMEYRFPLDDRAFSGSFEPEPREMRASLVRDVIFTKEKAFLSRVTAHNEKEGLRAWRLEMSLRDLADGITASTQVQAKSRLDRLLKDLSNIQLERPRDRSLQIWKLEYFQKFTVPFACLPFVILAFPLGLLARRSGRAVGFGIGLLMTSLYWGMLVAGRTLGLRTEISPGLVMIIPDVFLLVVGLLFYFTRRSR